TRQKTDTAITTTTTTTTTTTIPIVVGCVDNCVEKGVCFEIELSVQDVMKPKHSSGSLLRNGQGEQHFETSSQMFRAVASWSKASCLGLALQNARWFEASWGKKFSHEISSSVWDQCPPTIVMYLGSYDR
ncbi:hypothetical protein ANN_03183, partial [Periplaneta americana]